MSALYNWLWPAPKPGPARDIDVGHHKSVRAHFISLLDNTEPPDSFKISTVAQMLSPRDMTELGFEHWREVLPGLIDLAFEFRDLGDCDVIVKGRLAPDSATAEEVKGMEGPVRVRRKDYSGRTLHDRKPAATRSRW
ncbi:Protein of unknown function (DUF3253) [Teratosphaeria destructans]|uniref:Uncharacterized protein n=1 Tax=Teratosphaeria destructans TaxID=418781 RepID=A0A9W7SMV9_9PEZI|nr:Protein of unknown function (DUF3253) [Teratosphaeria destructans]